MQEAWLQAHPNDVVERLDLLTFFSPLHKKIYSDGYVKLIAHAPELWGMVFTKMDNPKLVQKLAQWRKAFASNSSRKFARFVKQFAPDVVLCTHYLPVELLGGLRKKWPGSPPLTVSIVTDFEAHALWMEPNVELYCVAAEETKARLVARGAAAERVLATGIPISAKFSAPIDTSAVRKQYGLRDDLPILLVLSGGFGMLVTRSPKSSLALDQIERPFQTLVVAGRNEQLRRDLAAQDRRHPTHVLGFVNNMQVNWMAVSDLLVTKPGGLTTSECDGDGQTFVHPQSHTRPGSRQQRFSAATRGAAISSKSTAWMICPFNLTSCSAPKARRDGPRGQSFGPPRRRLRDLPCAVTGAQMKA